MWAAIGTGRRQPTPGDSFQVVADAVARALKQRQQLVLLRRWNFTQQGGSNAVLQCLQLCEQPPPACTQMQASDPSIVRVRAPREPALLLQLRQQARDLRLVGVAVFDQLALGDAGMPAGVHQYPLVSRLVAMTVELPH